jgi:hypothetical protein
MEEVTARVEEIPPFTLEQLQAEFDALPNSPIEAHPRLRKYAAFEHLEHLDGTPVPRERVQEEAPLYAWFTSLHAKYGFLLASLAAARAEAERLTDLLAWYETQNRALLGSCGVKDERIRALEGESKRLRAIACRETCDCDCAFNEESRTDEEVMDPQYHANSCLWVLLRREWEREGAALAGRAESTGGEA